MTNLYEELCYFVERMEVKLEEKRNEMQESGNLGNYSRAYELKIASQSYEGALNSLKEFLEKQK